MGHFSWGIYQPGHEADLQLPIDAQVENAWSYTFTLPYIFMAQCLIKYMNKFTFTFY
jgi:hypothetical protein